MKKTYFFLIALLFAKFPMAGQDCFNECLKECTNAGFETGLTTGYCTYTGTIDSLGNVLIDKLELDTNRFAVLHIEDGIDTIANKFCKDNKFLPVVPEGWGNYALRLGNALATAKAERIVLRFTVTPELTFFLLNYAVVLNDPAHEDFEQPRFEMNILDKNDDPVDCGSYEVRAAREIPGFETCEEGWRVRPWTAVGFELQSFLGEEIQIEILTTDCSQGAHAGYAYIDASYRPLEIVLVGYCPDSTTAQIRVTEGFVKYEWEADSTNTSNILNLVNPEPESIYTVTVTSGTGCTLVLRDTIPSLGEFPPPTFDAITTIKSCPGDSVLIVPTGLNIEEITLLNNNYSDSSFVVAPDETTEYIFVGYGKRQCKADTLRVIVEIEQAIRTSFTTVSDSFCSGDEIEFAYRSLGFSEQTVWLLGDGRTYSGQTPPPTIYYTDTLREVTITLIDSNACEVDTFSKKITILALPDPAINIPPAVCVDAILSIAPATIERAELTYEWSFADGMFSTKRSLEHIYKKAGIDTIQLVINDASTNCANTSYELLTIHPLPVAEIEVSSIEACPPAKLELRRLPQSTSKDKYEWAIDGQPFSEEQKPTYIFNQEGNFQIELTIQSELQCSSTVNKNIVIPANPTAAILDVDKADCINTNIQLQSLAEEDHTFYQWTLSNGRTAYRQNPVFRFKEAGSIEVILVVSDGLCYDTTTATLEIVEPSDIKIGILEGDEQIDQGEVIKLKVLDYFLENPFFEWESTNGGSWIDESTISDKPLVSTRYSVSITEETGCVASDFIDIQVLQNRNIYIPNAFSPNADGVNDRFYPEANNPSIEEIKAFRIYDKWGTLCFERTNFNLPISDPWLGWDGTYKGRKAPISTYAYYLEIEFKDGELLIQTGGVDLLR